jgi:ferredoxin-NADP reductase/predicted pyridoxine 5'-phosphate oxidase superfamily flavin-nucleotide-binding protein
MSNASEKSPFHQGEKIMQQRVGKAEAMETIGRKVIRSYLPEQHREFFAKLPFVVVGSVDEAGRPWASILPGLPGFMNSVTPTSLDINATPVNGDPLSSSLKLGQPLGLLGIEIPTRRRNRLNARISSITEKGFSLTVDQSFGNCPQYIQTRDFRQVDNVDPTIKTTFTRLDSKAKKAISLSDTFFVASYVNDNDTNNPDITKGVDVSHRGGRPGFVAVEGNTLTIPDYAGNNLFNTLGNFLLNPKAGLLFPNFETGELLFLSGLVEIINENSPAISTFKGAQRGWRFIVEQGQKLTNALPFSARLVEYSPNSLLTGSWAQAKQLEVAQQQSNKWHSFKVIKVIDETADIRSFYLEKHDKGELVPFKAGQHLTIRIALGLASDLAIPNKKEWVIRNYTLSSSPHDAFYRISVKRELHGVASSHLHQNLTIGALIDAKLPQGNFWLDTSSKRPAVLLAGGVGITPMISMALQTYIEGIRMRHIRPLSIFHSAQTREQLAFYDDFTKLASATDNSLAYYPLAGKRIAKQVLVENSTDLNTLQTSDYFLCGPKAFMQAMYDLLLELGVADEQIFAETFGPAVLRRLTHESDIAKEADSTTLEFRHSKITQQWHKGDETLLVVAEKQGLSPAYSCRSGNCGSCAIKLHAGKVTYRIQPSVEIAENEVLICCAVPAKGTSTIILDL